MARDSGSDVIKSKYRVKRWMNPIQPSGIYGRGMCGEGSGDVEKERKKETETMRPRKK